MVCISNSATQNHSISHKWNRRSFDTFSSLMTLGLENDATEFKSELSSNTFANKGWSRIFGVSECARLEADYQKLLRCIWLSHLRADVKEHIDLYTKAIYTCVENLQRHEWQLHKICTELCRHSITEPTKTKEVSKRHLAEKSSSAASLLPIEDDRIFPPENQSCGDDDSQHVPLVSSRQIAMLSSTFDANMLQDYIQELTHIQRHICTGMVLRGLTKKALRDRFRAVAMSGVGGLNPSMQPSASVLSLRGTQFAYLVNEIMITGANNGPRHVDLLLNYFDENGDKQVDVNEFLKSLDITMPKARAAAVKHCFLSIMKSHGKTTSSIDSRNNATACTTDTPSSDASFSLSCRAVRDSYSAAQSSAHGPLLAELGSWLETVEQAAVAADKGRCGTIDLVLWNIFWKSVSDRVPVSKTPAGRTPLPDRFESVLNDVWRLDAFRASRGGGGGGGGSEHQHQETLLRPSSQDPRLRDISLKIVSNVAALWPVAHLIMLSSSSDSIAHLPYCLGHLPCLYKLVIQGRSFGCIPTSFAHSHLTELHIKDTNISAIPQSFGQDVRRDSSSNGGSGGLRLLRITNSSLRSIPSTFVETVQRSLVEANFALNELQFGTIPHNFWSLHALKVLSLERNRLSGPAPPGLGTLTSITHLCLSGNHISALPDTIGQLKLLETLLVDNNMLKTLPASIGELRALRVLSAHSNQLGPDLPDIWHRLDSGGAIETKGYRLQVLTLHSNKLRQLPSSICALEKLQVLNAHSNILETLPRRMSLLAACKELDAHKNALQKFPSEGFPPNLKVLNLNANKIEAVPSYFPHGHLHHSLTHLYLSDNLINSISDTMAELQSLKELHLERNQLPSIPIFLRHLSKSLLLLRIDGNPLQSTKLAEIVRTGVYHTPDEKAFHIALRKILDRVTENVKDFNAAGSTLETDKSWASSSGGNPAKSRRSRFKEIFAREVRRVCTQFDIDGSSGLSPLEFRHMLTALVPSLTRAEVESCCNIAYTRGGMDADGDGEITVDEFITVVQMAHTAPVRGNPTNALLKWCEYQSKCQVERSNDALTSVMSRNQTLEKELHAMERQKTLQQHDLRQTQQELNLTIHNIQKFETQAGGSGSIHKLENAITRVGNAIRTTKPPPPSSEESTMEAAAVRAKAAKHAALLSQKRALQAELDAQQQKLKSLKMGVAGVQSGSLPVEKARVVLGDVLREDGTHESTHPRVKPEDASKQHAQSQNMRRRKVRFPPPNSKMNRAYCIMIQLCVFFVGTNQLNTTG
jgi:Leucine-rich repeat (LRR) protein/Ca2+-binding EF-hand superfamily protein